MALVRIDFLNMFLVNVGYVLSFSGSKIILAGPNGPPIGLGLQPFACWDCGFESHRGMDVCLLWLLCVVRQRFLPRPIPRPGESYRVVCWTEWWRNFGTEEAKPTRAVEPWIYIYIYINRGFVSSITPTRFGRSVCSDGASIPKYRRLVRIYEMEFVWWN
jgi:hypothetical protein